MISDVWDGRCGHEARSANISTKRRGSSNDAPNLKLILKLLGFGLCHFRSALTGLGVGGYTYLQAKAWATFSWPFGPYKLTPMA